MGWSFRKSIGFGPVRVNFSKSGIGTSFGVKGARISAGPRGTYVSIGRGGIYYRQKIAGQAVFVEAKSESPQPEKFEDHLQEIITVGAEQLIDSSSAQLLNEINEKHRMPEFFIWGSWLLACLFVFILIAKGISAAFPFLLIGFGLIPLRKYDRKRKTIKLEYDLDGDAKIKYEALVSAIVELKKCNKVWRINAQGDSKDWKRNAGASTLVKRSPTLIINGAPKFMSTNVNLFQIHCTDCKLCFLPDTLLVYQGEKVGAVSYENLIVETDTTRFIENESIPLDGKKVGSTWQYVNKNGGPDRRFSNNKELPVMLYGVIRLSSHTGLHLLLNCSNSASLEVLKLSISMVGDFIKYANAR